MSLETTSEALTFEAMAAIHAAAIDLSRAARTMADLTGVTKARLIDARPDTPVSESERRRFERGIVILTSQLALLEALLALSGIGEEPTSDA